MLSFLNQLLFILSFTSGIKTLEINITWIGVNERALIGFRDDRYGYCRSLSHGVAYKNVAIS